MVRRIYIVDLIIPKKQSNKLIELETHFGVTNFVDKTEIPDKRNGQIKVTYTFTNKTLKERFLSLVADYFGDDVTIHETRRPRE